MSGKSILFSACCLALPLFSAAGEMKPAGAVSPPDFARGFRKHCVQVHIRARMADGRTPAMGSFGDDIRNERPTRLGGYWWDERHVLVEDAGLTDRFIRSIEIEPAGGGKRWPARVAARYRHAQAMLLEVIPDADGALPPADPLGYVRVPLDFEDHFVASYVWEDGEWRVRIAGGLGERTWDDDGVETVIIKNKGIVFSGAGVALGAAFDDSLRVIGGSDWLWRALMASGSVRSDRYRELQVDLGRKLEKAALEAHFRLRTEIEDDELSFFSPSEKGEIDESTSEVWSTAFVVGPRRVLIPVPLDARGIARMESITLRLADGSEIKAAFMGAVRDYMAIVAGTEVDLPADGLPPGFALLDPFIVPSEAFVPDSDFNDLDKRGLFLRWRIDYDLGRRRETADHDRWLGLHAGYGDEPIVSTLTNEDNGSLAFDLDGNLVAVSLAQRIPVIDSPAAGLTGARSPAFRPLGAVYEALHREGAIDPTLAPADPEDGRRLVDFGVEWQKLDANSARLFHAEKATRGGRIGLLVIRVYPDTPAAEMGIREHDVLLRVFLPEQEEPVELTPSDDHMLGISLLDIEDVSVEATQRMMASLPPPWPSRENALSTLLTRVGVGRSVRIEYLREGEPGEGEFVTRHSPADYRNAPQYKAASLGLTVKPVTYEVREFFRRMDSRGVIVSKVELGGRAAVAGLNPYLLVLGVDGAPVAGFEEFKEATAGFESGEAASIELLVEGFGKTRLVKIEK